MGGNPKHSGTGRGGRTRGSRTRKARGDFQQPLQGETVKEFGRQSSVKESKAELEEGNSKQDVATEEAQPVIELEEEGNSKQVAEGVTVQEQPPESKPANEFGRHNSGKTDKDNKTESKEEGNNSNLSEDGDAENVDLDKIVSQRRKTALEDIDQARAHTFLAIAD